MSNAIKDYRKFARLGDKPMTMKDMEKAMKIIRSTNEPKKNNNKEDK